VAIIDFLQEYTLFKRMERFLKGITVKDLDEISVAPPKEY
jgi:hypothetical protein